MNYIELLQQIFQVCIIPLIGVLTAFLIQFIKIKQEEILGKAENETLEKYIKMLSDTITACVIATNQTYVNSLKEQGKFDAAAQKIALQMTYDAVLKILSEDAKEYLTNAFGDLEAFINQKIEESVNQNRLVISD